LHFREDDDGEEESAKTLLSLVTFFGLSGLFSLHRCRCRLWFEMYKKDVTRKTAKDEKIIGSFCGEEVEQHGIVV